MSSVTAKDPQAVRLPSDVVADENGASLETPLPLAARYALSLAMVVAATVVAFIVDHLIQSSSLSLVFVLPVVIAAASCGWGPAMAAAVAGVLALDFFFV